MKALRRVNLYFLASPLQCLAAAAIVRELEGDACNIALPYKPGARDALPEVAWSKVDYVPWPRFDPLPGPLGKLRRLLKNLRHVEALVPECDELCLHTAVLDTEAINYYVNCLRRRFPSTQLSVRILPDGLISTRRYPMNAAKKIGQRLRKVRRLISPRLDYYRFTGDRIGSDAEVVDRIYVLAGFPHEYPSQKVMTLPPLFVQGESRSEVPPRALVIGQPLVGAGLLPAAELTALGDEIEAWLAQQGVEEVDYKRHPKDPNAELMRPHYHELETREALESWLLKTRYRWIVGVRSTALLMATQLCDEHTTVYAAGLDRVIFKSDVERRSMQQTFIDAGVILLPPAV